MVVEQPAQDADTVFVLCCSAARLVAAAATEGSVERISATLAQRKYGTHPIVMIGLARPPAKRGRNVDMHLGRDAGGVSV